MRSANWINKYWDLQEEIDELEWDIRKTKVEVKRWEKGGDLFNKSNYETALSHQQRIGQALGNLENVLKDKQQLKTELLDLIDTFQGLDNQILKMKHIDGMALEDIAEELNYSFSHISKKHAEIMKTLKIIQKVSNK